MSLQTDIEQLRRQIATDSYPMSIGELANIYRDDEVDIHPEFQRIYRWTVKQKTRLIESILLGIPLPSIFVAQNESGIWDVVDGVQRLSTIFQFMGICRDEDGALLPPLECVATRYLPDLEGRKYEDEDPKRSLDSAQRLDFKRAKVDIKIIKRESDPRAKYDLFQRLNSLGSQATAQELRNCLLVSINRDMYKWLRDLSRSGSFVRTTDLPDKDIEQQYDMELALRFLVLRRLPRDGLKGVENLGEFLDDHLVELAERSEEWRIAEGEAFIKTFEWLEKGVGLDIFRKWNKAKEGFEGGFSLTAFEVLALGLGFYIQDLQELPEGLPEKVRALWSDPKFGPGFSTGLSADKRMRKTLPFGRELFADLV